MIPLPNKKYNIIYADPPWSFRSKELQKYDGKRFTSLEKHYPTQTKNWIKNLAVNKITKKDCALFLWSTDAHIKEAIETMESWGFKYITIAFIWEKITKNGKTVANLGSWTMKNYEICLFGTKGKMLKYKKVNNVYQKVLAQRTIHSKKPYKIIENIEKLFGDLPRIELFAREKHNDWDCWGNEI
jgi:site-specific DNA-methyltransferase (adenine-specific)